MARLADRGQHRGLSIPAPIVAAIAELAGLTVLHLDKDFDIVAGLTGEPFERRTRYGLVPKDGLPGWTGSVA